MNFHALVVLVSSIFLPIHARHRCHSDDFTTSSTTPTPTTTPPSQTCPSGICASNLRECTCFFGRIQVSDPDYPNGNMPGLIFAKSSLLNNCSELLNEIGTDGGLNKCYQTSSYHYQTSVVDCFCDKNVTFPSNPTAPPAVQPPPCNATQCAARSYQFCFCDNTGAFPGTFAFRPIPSNVTSPNYYCLHGNYPNCANIGQVCGCEQISGTDQSQCVCRACDACDTTTITNISTTTISNISTTTSPTGTTKYKCDEDTCFAHSNLQAVFYVHSTGETGAKPITIEADYNECINWPFMGASCSVNGTTICQCVEHGEVTKQQDIATNISNSQLPNGCSCSVFQNKA